MTWSFNGRKSVAWTQDTVTCVVCVVIDEKGALVFRCATQPDDDALPENLDDPYADCAEKIVQSICGAWHGSETNDTPYSQEFIDSRCFLFLPHEDMLVEAKHREAVKGLEGSIAKIIGEPVQVRRYEPASNRQGAFISVFHEGEHLPKVLLEGKQVLPMVPNSWPEH
jgi:hypothetical protein